MERGSQTYMGNSVHDCLSPLVRLPAAHSYGRQELKGEVLTWTRGNARALGLLVNFVWIPARWRSRTCRFIH